MKNLALSLLFLSFTLFSGCFSLFPKKQPAPPASNSFLLPAKTESPDAISKKEKALLAQAAKQKAKQEKLAQAKNNPQNTPQKRKSIKEMLLFWWPKDKPKPPSAMPLTPIASIYVVNAPGKFVVLDSPSPHLAVGQVLSTLNNGTIQSTFRITDDRTPPFIVAEILSGSPSRGDAVYAVEP